MNSRLSGVFTVLIFISPLAFASSEAAWQQSDKQMQQACLSASQLASVKIVSKPIVYDDSVGYSAILLEGRYPQQHMKNQRGRELCLYERRTGKAHVSEADALRAIRLP